MTTSPWDESVLVIQPIFRNYRYLFNDGNVLDVSSPYQANSIDRGLALEEANRRWGRINDGKSGNARKIEGVSTLPQEASDEG